MRIGARKIALISALTALAVSLRLAKHAMAGVVQFVNVPLALSMASGLLFGVTTGFGVGLLAFTISDAILGLGPWTPVDAVAAALAGGACGLLSGKAVQRTEMFVLTFLLTFAYDVATSTILYALFGLNLYYAFIAGIVGLFLPVMGGYLLAVGPVTELLTSLLTIAIVEGVRRRLPVIPHEGGGWVRRRLPDSPVRGKGT